jgi:hydroxymethylbilane synthase
MNTDPELRLGTRGSQLALWQANTVAARIAAAGGPACRIVVIKTGGDRSQERPLSEIGGKGLFVKEIEDALLEGAIDLAVHSSKDMSAVLPDGLTIAAVLPRENPLDAVALPLRRAQGSGLRAHEAPGASEALSAQHSALTSIEALTAVLGASPSIGTGSVRRIAQLTRLFPGARFTPIRGNLDTRLRKLDEGAHDALVLAAAGLTRLGFAARISLAIPAEACVPAPGQGIVAIEIRGDDERAREAVSRINDAAAGDALSAERALLQTLGGGCQTPVGALASIVEGGQLEIVAVVAALDGSRVVRGRAQANRQDAAALGARVGVQLLADGARGILAEIERSQGKSQVSSLNSQDRGSPERRRDG